MNNINQMLFCKISSMKYYKGAGPHDVPYNGGSFVDENGYGHEEYNFLEREINGDWEDDSGIIQTGRYCLGFVETKSTAAGKSNSLHIERICGCSLLNKELSVNGITVVWCATTDLNETSVVGWYRDAIVYRNYQEFTDNTRKNRYYNVLAKSDKSVLLPEGIGHKHIWRVPSSKQTKAFGFGQSMLWYAGEEKAEGFLRQLGDNIVNYDGENWLYEYPKS
jgi:hypothetical protein